MWKSWLPSRVHKISRSRSFSCSSFKDVLTLSGETESCPTSPRSPTIFHRVALPNSYPRNNSLLRANSEPPPPPQPMHSIVVYFTSLRVVRRTFEDCRLVLSILRGLGVPIDERDLAMDASFVCELQRIIGGRLKATTLPCVFIDGRLIGGAEEVKRLYESGELAQMIGGGSQPAGAQPCTVCGGLKYVVCDHCNGSRKIYGKTKSKFRNCTDCNMHGLMKCPSCFGNFSEKRHRSNSIDIPIKF